MSNEFIGTTLDVMGNVFIALVVLSVHARIAKERSIDARVISVMKREKVLVVMGILLVIVGYIVRIPGFIL